MRLGFLGLEEASLDNKPVKDNRPFVLVDKTTPVKTKKTQFTYVVARWIFRSGGLDGICDEAENGANPQQ